ncbi:hypothetical protein [Reichenbachiella versicolor]|uniref:hypothetical protein n=1 Tax=Reichenbachiella versicolor TaxID=1821036 RepID=UPI000D6EA4C4|nr:hypothetical protein [Reichenbachiella versicolor]
MNPKKLNRIAVFIGFIVLVFMTAQFQKTYQNGDPKWNYLFMAFGMAIMLLFSLFGKFWTRKKK